MKESLKAIIIGAIEGVTEFLPISSTGHQIIAADLLNFTGEKAVAFNIMIQFAAILAIVFHFRNKIFLIIQGCFQINRHTGVNVYQALVIKTLLAFLPAAILGLIFIDYIRVFLFNPITVASSLILGGIVMLYVEQRNTTHINEHITKLENITYIQAIKIGFFQSIAMIPGVSRSAATIIGAMFNGLSRSVATEFSFFLAIPTMLAATLYSSYKYYNYIIAENIDLLIIGSISSFIFAFFSISILLKYIANHSYQIFAIYRIIIGSFILITWYLNIINWSMFYYE